MAVSPSKTQGTSVLTVQNLANNTVLLSSAQNVATKFRVTLFIRVGRDTTTALTNAVNIAIQAQPKTAGTLTDASWNTIQLLQSQIAAALTKVLAGSSNAAAQAVLTSSGTNWDSGNVFTDRMYCFIKNGTIGNSEFVRIVHVTSATTVTCFDNLVNTQTSSNVFSGAEEFVIDLDVTAIGSIRIAIDTLLTGQAVNVEAWMVTCDSIG